MLISGIKPLFISDPKTHSFVKDCHAIPKNTKT